MSKKVLLFSTEAEAEAAQQAIRDEGAKIFAEEGFAVDAQGRVVSDTGKVLIDRFSRPRQITTGQWIISDPETEDWSLRRVRSGQWTRQQGDQANAAFASRVKAKITGLAPASVPFADVTVVAI